MNLMTSSPSVMWRDSSDWAEKPKLTVAMSPLYAAPNMKGINSRLVSTYSNENEMAVTNSNGPADSASSKYDFGTDRYQARSNMWNGSWKPSKYLLYWLIVWSWVCAWRSSSIDCICEATCA